MKHLMHSFVTARRNHLIVLALQAVIPAFVILLSLGTKFIVEAVHNGDTSLIHACKDSRGRLTQVGDSDSCNTGETEVTWLKDVVQGSGVTITRGSGGATIAVASSSSSDGWTAAGETWTYASADDPTFTFTTSGDKTDKYSTGMRVKLTQTSAKYFLITKVAYSNPNTTVTVYGGTDYDLVNASITSPYYSTDKAPQGFPLNPNKWTVEVKDTTDRTQASPTNNTWYNMGAISLDIPIGAWDVSYQVSVHSDNNTYDTDFWTTLSTTNNGQSDSDLTTFIYDKFRDSSSGGTDDELWDVASKHKVLDLTSKTTCYLNERTSNSADNLILYNSALFPAIIRAVSSYL